MSSTLPPELPVRQPQPQTAESKARARLLLRLAVLSFLVAGGALVWRGIAVKRFRATAVVEFTRRPDNSEPWGQPPKPGTPSDEELLNSLAAKICTLEPIRKVADRHTWRSATEQPAEIDEVARVIQKDVKTTVSLSTHRISITSVQLGAGLVASLSNELAETMCTDALDAEHARERTALTAVAELKKHALPEAKESLAKLNAVLAGMPPAQSRLQGDDPHFKLRKDLAKLDPLSGVELLEAAGGTELLDAPGRKFIALHREILSSLTDDTAGRDRTFAETSELKFRRTFLEEALPERIGILMTAAEIRLAVSPAGTPLAQGPSEENRTQLAGALADFESKTGQLLRACEKEVELRFSPARTSVLAFVQTEARMPATYFEPNKTLLNWISRIALASGIGLLIARRQATPRQAPNQPSRVDW